MDWMISDCFVKNKIKQVENIIFDIVYLGEIRVI